MKYLYNYYKVERLGKVICTFFFMINMIDWPVHLSNYFFLYHRIKFPITFSKKKIFNPTSALQTKLDNWKKKLNMYKIFSNKKHKKYFIS